MVLKKKSILIVEDEVSLRKALKVKLIKEGYMVLEAVNGQEGMDQAFSQHPDLILTDIVMPLMDGMTFLKNLRKDAWGKKVKVIILTNLSDAEKQSTAEKAGVTSYLVKTNWKLEDLMKQIKAILK